MVKIATVEEKLSRKTVIVPDESSAESTKIDPRIFVTARSAKGVKVVGKIEDRDFVNVDAAMFDEFRGVLEISSLFRKRGVSETSHSPEIDESTNRSAVNGVTTENAFSDVADTDRILSMIPDARKDEVNPEKGNSDTRMKLESDVAAEVLPLR